MKPLIKKTQWKRWIGLVLMPLASGCDRSPSINILGSFFPIWLFCAVVGTVLALVVYTVLQRIDWAHQLAPGILVYPSLAVLFSLSIWLVFYS